MQNKERLDKYLTDLGYFETKSKAASAILAGNVKINDEYITKAGYQINLNKEYDKLQKIYGDINLHSIYNGGYLWACIKKYWIYIKSF